MTTYGAYRDDAARALAGLLGASPVPQLNSDDVDRVLGCRDLLLTSLRQQFHLATGATGSSNLRLASVETNPVSAFGAVLGRAPTVGPGEAPTDVLASRSSYPPYVESWRQAARSSLLAADVLDSTRSWRTDPQATWAAVTDVAEAAWALSVLDTGLSALAQTDTAQHRNELGRGGLGLLARLTVDLARQGPFNRNLDRLTRPTLARVGPRPLSEFEHAAGGQQRVARMLHQRGGVVPVKALGPLLVGQARISAAIADAATRLQEPRSGDPWLNGHEHDTAAALAGAARARAEALTSVAKARKGVADIVAGGEPVVWQTAEVLRAVQRRSAPGDRVQTVGQLRHLQELAERQDAVSKLLVAGVLRAFARGEYLVPHPDRNQLQWRPCIAEAEPPLKGATENLDRVLQLAVLPRRLEPEPHTTATRPAVSAPQQLADALSAHRPDRPPSPGMRLGQPLTP